MPPSGRRLTAPPPPVLQDIEQRMLLLGCPSGLGPVLGEGDPTASLVLVGEAPGEREVTEGYPFAGPAGRLLDSLLAGAGLERQQIWLTNTVKCRPIREQGGRVTNRAPLAGELKAWLPLLLEELAAVQPRVIVCAGGTSARALLGKDFRLTEQRGEWFLGPHGARTLATFHPAYILHLQPHSPEDSDAATQTLARDLATAAAVLRGEPAPVMERSP